MAVNPDADTEFNDALRAHGILPPKPPTPPSPSTFLPSAEELRHHVLSQADVSALEQLEEDANSEDERLFASYRAKKLAEVKEEERKKARAGNETGGDGVAIREISRDDFVREVSEASKRDVEGKDGDEDDAEEDIEEDGRRRVKGKGKVGMGVVCFLYKDGIPFSQHLHALLLQLSPHTPLTKYVKIRADQCIEGYPDRNVPTMLLYRAGDCVGSVTPWSGGGMSKGVQMTVQDLERILLQHGILSAPSDTLAKSLRATAHAANGSDSDRSSDDDDFGTIRRGKAGQERGMRASGGKGIGLSRTGGRDADEEDDSDFDI